MSILVDLFAGGGGASQGIKDALGYDPDLGVNHDRVAIAMHMANHPDTTHICQDIWQVSPRLATGGRPVDLLWASPDCKHFSKAKGSAPKRDVEIRSLAWVVEKWARDVQPRVIILENVEEFKSWGPIDSNGGVIPSQKGTTFTAFMRSLRKLGYKVDHRDLRACDYGAPTIRKRLFIIARCDGLPIVWPEPTHGPGLIPYRTAAEIIDWDIPCPSIFERKKPLAENTMKRIAEGIKRYVLEAKEPFIVPLTHHGKNRVYDINNPLNTVTAAHRGEMALVAPHIQRQFGQGVGSAANQPVGTVTAGGLGKSALVTAFLAKHFSGVVGHEIDKPTGTVTTIDHHSVVTAHLTKFYRTSKAGRPINEPMHTITSGGQHIGEVRAFLMKYYGEGGQWQGLNEPAHTIPTKDRLGLVTVMIGNEPYVITDIGMRMLMPRELFRAQGFTDDYKIDIEIEGKRITKTDQVRLCGNSVCPPIAKALVQANVAKEDITHAINDIMELGDFQIELAPA